MDEISRVLSATLPPKLSSNLSFTALMLVLIVPRLPLMVGRYAEFPLMVGRYPEFPLMVVSGPPPTTH